MRSSLSAKFRTARRSSLNHEEWRAFLSAFENFEGFKAYLWRQHKAAPARIVGEKNYGVGRRIPTKMR